MKVIEMPTAVLFACTMNAIRSPMAAGILHYFHGTQIYVDSAGVHEGDPDHFAITVMHEIGIDIERHQPKTFDELEDSYFDLVVSLSPKAQHKAVEMTRTMACDVEFWHTFDPSCVEGSRENRLMAYRQVRDELVNKVKHRFPEDPFTNGAGI